MTISSSLNDKDMAANMARLVEYKKVYRTGFVKRYPINHTRTSDESNQKQKTLQMKSNLRPILHKR